MFGIRASRILRKMSELAVTIAIPLNNFFIPDSFSSYLVIHVLPARV